MTYEEAASYIEDVPKFTKKTGPDHALKILGVLGHPEESFKVIHVAGTNGKGSVCAYINSMLTAGGYSCGMFTSPHLVRVNERFQVNGREVSDEDFLWAFERVMEAAEAVMTRGEAHPTYFEILFLMGMVIFRKYKVEYCILETGLGGRLDLTNVVKKPLVCIITSISFDHMEYLGSTIPEIAGEKAGILKEGTPAVFDDGNPEASEVIARRAAELNIPAYRVRPEQIRLIRQDSEGIVFEFREDPESNEGGGIFRLEITSVADYQMMNAALAFRAMKVIQSVHGIEDDTLAEAISDTRWPCRMEMVKDGVVIDGAHNADGVAALIRTASHFHDKQELTILFSAVADKEYPRMIREICAGLHPEHVVTTSVGGSRSNSAEKMALLFSEGGCSDVTAETDVKKAFVLAEKKKGTGILFCVGSLYLAGELKAIISQCEKPPAS